MNNFDFFWWLFVGLTLAVLVLVPIIAFRPKRKNPIDFWNELNDKRKK